MKSILFLLFIFLSLLAGCHKSADYQSPPTEYSVMDESPKTEEQTSEKAEVPGKFVREDKDLEKKPSRREVIYTANLQIQVDKLQPAIQGIAKLIKEKNGYLSAENHTTYSGQSRVEMIARVPKEAFVDFVSGVETFSVYTASKNITAQDVTEEFVDIEARLRSKKAAEERFLELMKTAKTIGEVMDVENQLRTIREEIEARQGRLNFLQSQVTYSTVTVSMYEEKPMVSSPQAGFWYQIKKGFENGWEGILGFIIGAVNLWPVWIVFAAIWAGYRWYKRKKAQSN